MEAVEYTVQIAQTCKMSAYTNGNSRIYCKIARTCKMSAYTNGNRRIYSTDSSDM